MKYCMVLMAWLLLSPVTVSAGDNNELLRKALIGRGDDIRLLIKKGANPNARDYFGWPAIAVAANRRDESALEAVQALVENGADVNAVDNEKHYALMNAIENGSVKIVRYLLENGADYYVSNADKYTAIQWAKEYENKEIISMIASRIAADEAREAALRSPERRKSLMYEFSYAVCAHQYYKYYVAVGQADFEDRNVDQELKIYADLQEENSVELQKYFNFTHKVLTDIVNLIATDIYGQLDEFVSPRHRRKSGVGTDRDISRRCGEIAENWKKQY